MAYMPNKQRLDTDLGLTSGLHMLLTLSKGSLPVSTKSITLPGVPTTISAPAQATHHIGFNRLPSSK
jgi:hypothetical protein